MRLYSFTELLRKMFSKNNRINLFYIYIRVLVLNFKNVVW